VILLFGEVLLQYTTLMTINYYNKSKLFLVVFLSFFAANTFAQKSNGSIEADEVQPFATNDEFRTWSIALNTGGLSQYTVFLGSSDYKNFQTQIGYGLTLKKQLVPSFALQADVFGGKLQSKVSNMDPPNMPGPYTRFSTQINAAASLSANFSIVNINWRNSEAFVQPYATLGGGVINYKATTYDYSNVGTAQKIKSSLMVPIGLGIKLGLSRAISLDVGYQVNFVDADDLDGYQFNGNSDKFSYTKIGIEIMLGKSGRPRLASHNAIPAMRDEYVNGIASLQNKVEELQKKTDSIKTKNEILAKTVDKISKDSDGDGVADQFDKCPNTPRGTKVDGSGCPLPPSEIKYVYVTAEDKKVASEVVTTLEFDLMKSTIKPSSYPNLDKLATVLTSKNIKLKLDGYTDNTGADWRNLAISKSRAVAIKNYLVKKGANPANIEATGHGNENPIASNETLEGRRQNRRVVFTLINGVDNKK
jgi:OOP family OmpA-OmpF porin